MFAKLKTLKTDSSTPGAFMEALKARGSTPTQSLAISE